MVNLADANHDAELLQAQAHVWNHIFNFINSMSLKCAIQLGIPDVIHNHGKPITLSQLISSLPVHPAKARRIPRLMRLLVHSGFFAQAKISEDDDQEEGTDNLKYVGGNMFEEIPPSDAILLKVRLTLLSDYHPLYAVAAT
ncbi:hypothetical protein GH714_043666 [Hevea brasiliensis]|uniref:O-methyltransferase dimerisation domain-containing protein n=1 Tax=Hevea brasiliensis TaxID=3981 RepID=A0A6A6K3B2_HEVBR|nr:hypothetical protein GH714_043666 [Hevea brasiliensis]